MSDLAGTPAAPSTARTTAVWRWAVAAVVTQIVFVLSCLLAGFWQGPRYSWLNHSISDMYAVGAPRGMFLVVVLTLCGIVVICFALGSVRPVLRPGGWAATAGSILLALSVFGFGDLLSPFEREACRQADPGCSPADQAANLGGTLDNVITTIGFMAFIAALFFLAGAMERVPGWERRARPFRWAAIAVIVLLVATGLSGAIDLDGLAERLLAFAGAAAIGALAWDIAAVGRE